MADPYYGNVSSLLHFDGADGDFSAADTKGLSWTWSTGTRLTDDTAKFGATSLELNGYLSRHITASDASLAMGTGDFTIEGHFRCSQSSAGDYIFDCGSSSFRLLVDLLKVRYLDPGLSDYSTSPLYTDGPTVSVNTWYHFAITRSGTTVRAFLDGVQWGSDTSSYNDTSNAFYYGRRGDGISSSYLFGWLDECRITKGVARYTSNFTPPAAAFTTAEAYIPLDLAIPTPDTTGEDMPIRALDLGVTVPGAIASHDVPALALSFAVTVPAAAFLSSQLDALALPLTIKRLPNPIPDVAPAATPIFRLVVITDAAVHYVSIATFTLIYRYLGTTYLTASIHNPDADLIADMEAATAPSMKLQSGYRMPDGTETWTTQATVGIDTATPDLGGGSYSLTCSGSQAQEHAPKEYWLGAAISVRGSTVGSAARLWTGPHDPNVAPGDKVHWTDGTEMIVGNVTVTAGDSGVTMTLSELPYMTQEVVDEETGEINYVVPDQYITLVADLPW